MYVRFAVKNIDEISHRRQGVMQAAYELKNADWLTGAELAHLKEITRWFDLNLRAPDRFSRSRRRHAQGNGVCWFKETAGEHIAMMRELCGLLEQCGTWTEMLTTRRPGCIVYEDEHQVCAVPFNDTTA